MSQTDFINYSKFFNNTIKAYQILFDKSLKSFSLDKYRTTIFKQFSINQKRIAIPMQTHSNRVQLINKHGVYENCDGLITYNEEIILSLQTADCVPIFLIDIEKNMKGLIHSGWKGTKNKIINNAISMMINNGSSLSNILIVIGASIHKCCYQIGEELVDYFDQDCILYRDDKIYLSLQEQIINDLRKLYIPENNIHIDNLCTFTNNQLSSYRRERSDAGRMISLLGNY